MDDQSINTAAPTLAPPPQATQTGLAPGAQIAPPTSVPAQQVLYSSPLVNKWRANYPGVYDDIDNATLQQKILAKYPQYQDLANPIASPAQDAADTSRAGTTPTDRTSVGIGSVNTERLHNLGQGIQETGQDVWGAITGLVTAPPPGVSQLHEGIQEAIPSFHAYENARSQGKGVWESIQAANDELARQQAARDVLKQRIDEFKKNPQIASIRAIGDAAALVAVTYGGATLSAPEAGTTFDTETGNLVAPTTEAAAVPEPGIVNTEAAEVPKPGIVKQIVQGEKVAQPGARAALRSGAQASAVDAGVEASAETGGSIRSLMNEPIESLAAKERAAYDTINNASGTDLKSLYDHVEAVQDALDDPTNVSNRSALQEDLKNTQESIAKGEAKATENGVDPNTLNQAKEMTKQRYSMENVDSKLFNNEGVVNGNVEHGAPETINIKSAIRQVENLDKPSKFAPRGTPTRLEQALGVDGAKALKQGLYDAQKAGQTAATRQTVAKWVGGSLGLTALTKMVSAASNLSKE